MKEVNVKEFPTRYFVMRRKKTKPERSPKKPKEKEQVDRKEEGEESKEEVKPVESEKVMKTELKPAIGKPALWPARSSTATFVKKAPWSSPKTAHSIGKRSVGVPCGGVGSSGDRKRTVSEHDDDMGRTQGESNLETYFKRVVVKIFCRLSKFQFIFKFIVEW